MHGFSYVNWLACFQWLHTFFFYFISPLAHYLALLPFPLSQWHYLLEYRQFFLSNTIEHDQINRLTDLKKNIALYFACRKWKNVQVLNDCAINACFSMALLIFFLIWLFLYFGKCVQIFHSKIPILITIKYLFYIKIPWVERKKK